MVKKTVLAVLSIDGCLSDNRTERSWMLRSDVYGIDEFYDAIGEESLVEADVENVGYVCGLLADGKVERLIVYIVPYLSGGNSKMFSTELSPTHWILESTKVFSEDVVCSVYRYEPVG